MQNSCFRADVWETVIDLITHLHSFSFGIFLPLWFLSCFGENLTNGRTSSWSLLYLRTPTEWAGPYTNPAFLGQTPPQKSVPGSLNQQIVESEIVWH